jgi:hypothetical protein
MSMMFTEAQLEEIRQLAIGAGSPPHNNTTRPFSGVYSYILHLISENGDLAQGPAPGVENGIWQWFRGAMLINKGEGIFSTFIREYTAEQNRIRTSEGVSQEKMNEASDEIGAEVVKSIIGLKELIDLDIIGRNDALGMTKALKEITIAGWSGNLLFPMLGRPEFFIKNITTPDNDSYNFFALIRSANFALTQTLGNSWGDIFDGLKTVMNLAYGESSTLDLGVLKLR